MSKKDESEAASAVDIFGELVDDAGVFRGVKDGEKMAVERV